MRKSIQDSVYWDIKLSWASTAFFIGSVANASLKTILPIPESMWGVMSSLFGISIIFVFGMYFKELFRRSSIVLWRSYLIFIALYTMSAILITTRGESLSLMITGTALLTFAWWIPAGVYACSVSNKAILYNVWVKASFFISFFSILMYLFYIPTEQESGSTQYNISFGFYIILPLLFQINEYTVYKRWWLLLLILFEVFTILVYANRGVLLSLVFFVIYKFAFESKSRFRKILSILFLIVVTLLMLSSIQTIATVAVTFLNAFGIESRTLDMLAIGVASDSSGRDEIWKLCFKMIEERPIFGWGLGGEYTEIGKQFEGVTPDMITPAYNPHNGIIQNFVCFGIIGGLITSIMVLYPLLHLKQPKDRYTHDLLLIFASASVIPICISSSGFFITPAVAIYLYLFYRRMPSPVSVKSI